MAYGDKPFGLRDIKLTNITGTTQVDLPAAQQMSVKPRLTSAEFRGDDRLKAIVAVIDGAEWSLAAGGISLAALAIVTGKSTVVTGTTPNEVTKLTLVGGDNMPYFKIYGKSIGDGADDVHVKIFKAKMMTLDGNFQDGQFYVTNCTGLAIEDDVNGVMQFVQNETAANLPAS